jgi:ParB family transcriptional regulator, chromosome partitioning protein
MAKRDRLNVDSFFSEVDQNQEVYNLRERLQALEQQLDQQVNREQDLVIEIEQLRTQPSKSNGQQLQNQIGELREHLEQNQGTLHYAVESILPNLDQPRKSFTGEVEAMALSLQQEGQLDPVILFEDGMLFDGECRWRAAKLLGWKTLEAVVTTKPDDPGVLRRRAYLTTLHRRSLNALDKAETLIAIVCDEVPDLPPEDVPRLVNRVLTRLKRRKQSFGDRLHLQPPEQQQSVLKELEIEPDEAQVFQIFLGLQEHPASLSRNIFPSLNLADDLKAAVRETALGCSQAILLNRISATELEISERQALKLRERGVKEVLKQSLSTVQTQEWVTQQRTKHIKSSEAPSRDKQVDRLLTTVQRLDLLNPDVSLEQLHDLQQALEAALLQVKQRLK